jgi:hypothetical protein
MRRLSRPIALLLLFASASCTTAGDTPAAAPEGATHAEVRSITGTPEGKFGGINSVSMDGKGNLLVCDDGKQAVLVVSPDGTLVGTLEPGFAPNSACVHSDETTYVGGTGKLVKLDGSGKVVASVDVPDQGLVAGIATTATDVFAALRVGYSFTVTRYSHRLTDAKPVISRLRGCCGQMHIVAAGDKVFAAENARHRVVSFDREGKEAASWGKAGRTNVEDFGSCCNPMNLWAAPDGSLYTSEASLGRVKHYSADGKFLGLVGNATVDGGCVNVSVVASSDGSRVFVLDRGANAIRVLEKK